MVAFGALVELAWLRVSRREWERPELPRLRATPVLATVALCSVLASVQVSAPFNQVPGAERSVVLAVGGLAFTAWADLALTVEVVASPGRLRLVQLCWRLAVFGSRVQPGSLRATGVG